MTSGAEAARRGKHERKAGSESILSVVLRAEAWTSRKRFARGPGMGCEGADSGCGSGFDSEFGGRSCETGSADGVAIFVASKLR